jgi:two-component system response regulator FixJ
MNIAECPATDTAVVHIIDDDASVQDSIADLLRVSCDFLVKTYGCAESFLESFQPETVNCVVTDVRLPKLSGIDLCGQLKDSEVPVLIITGHADVSMAVDAMGGGAFDFFEKPFQPRKLLDRIKEAIAWAEREAEERRKRFEMERQLEQLTVRERQVLDQLLEGQSLKQIAFLFEISHQAVARHRSKILEKLEADGEIQLIRRLLDAGMS